MLPMITPPRESLDYWHSTVYEWKNTKDLPLYIRKFNASFPRGYEATHSSGRRIISTDNSPAQWICSCVFNNTRYSVDDIRKLIESDKIPIAMILPKKDLEKATYKHTLANLEDDPIKKGWKIAHIDAIGLKSRAKLTEMPIEKLEEHFVRFLDPQNTFLFPNEYAGLAEVAEFINVFSSNKEGR